MRARRSKSWIVAVVLLLTAVVWFAWRDAGPAIDPAQRPASGESLPQGAELSGGTSTEVPKRSQRTVLRGPVPVSTTASGPGSLRIELSYANGDPGVGLVVEVAPDDLARDEASQRRLEVRSDAAGLVVCGELVPGAYSVFVIHPTHLDEKTSVQPGEETVLPIRFQRGRIVSGTVVDRNDRPVTGASVWSRFGLNSQQPVTRSDDRGCFALRAASQYLILGATKAGYAPSANKRVRGQPGDKVGIRLVLQGEGGQVRGLVVAPDGEPVSGAVVIFPNTGLPWTFWGEDRLPFGVQAVRVRTNAAGRFLATGLPPLKIPVVAKAPGHGTVRHEIEVNAGQTAEILMRLSPTAAIHGRVLDATGAGIDGAQIYASSELAGLMRRTRTDDTGAYRLSDLTPGAVTLQFRWGQRSVFDEIQVAEGEDRKHDVRTAVPGVIRGRLLDDRGRPLVGWEVVGVSTGGDVSGTKSLEGGRFELGDLIAAHRYRLQFHRPRSENRPPCHTIRGVTPGSTESIFRLPAAAFELGSIRVRFVDWQGRPVPDIRLRFTHLDSHYPVRGLGRTENGGFLVEDLPAGGYQLLFVAGGQFRTLPEFTLSGGQELDLGDQQLAQPGTVSIDFAVPYGRRVASLALFDERRSMCGIVALPKGRLADYPIAEGSYYVQSRDDGISSQLIPFEVKGGEHTRLRLALHAGLPCTLAFGFADQNLYTVMTVSLTVKDASGDVFLHESVPRPFRVSRHFPPGKYSLNATSRGGASVEDRFEIADDAPKQNKFSFLLQR